MEKPGYITIDRPTLDRLREHYESALDAGEQSFEFQGREILTAFAKYMIEYCEGELKRREKAWEPYKN